MSAKLVVAKFGGTSLATAAQFRKVIRIIKADPRRHAIVVSAPGARFKGDPKVTDMLYALRNSIERGEPDRHLFAKIEARFAEVIRGLGLNPKLLSPLKHVWDRDAGGVLGRHKVPDAIPSTGEYLSGLILAKALGFRFISPTYFVRIESSGRPDMEATQELFKRNVARYLRKWSGYRYSRLLRPQSKESDQDLPARWFRCKRRGSCRRCGGALLRKLDGCAGHAHGRPAHR